MRLVKCQCCGKLIDRSIEQYIHKSNGYSHTLCEEEKTIKKNTVICQKCRQPLNKLTDEYIQTSAGYIHQDCITPEEWDKSRLHKYITELFGLKAPGPVNMALIKKFISNNGYTYKSIYYTLKYYYEIKHGSIEKADERIGIVPYIYEEAKQYYENLQKTQIKILNNVEKHLNMEEKTLIIKHAPNSKKKTIDLEGL